MDKEQLLTELFKGGISFLGGTLTQIISDINTKRLAEKKTRKKEKLFKISSNTVELKDSEKISGDVDLNTQLAYERIKSHIEEIKRWANIIKFSDLDKKKTLGSVYIQLDTYLIPAKRHFSSVERDKTEILEDAVLKGKDHCVILGQPGAGKSTSLKKICDIIIQEEAKSNYTFPILLRLRDLGDFNSRTPILDHISKLLPLEFNLQERKDSKFESGAEEAKEEAMYAFINFIEPILILDGFDELKNSNTKLIVLEELKNLSRKLTDAKIVLSCRTGEFNYELEQSNTYEIAPLNDQQIELFVKKWLNNDSEAKDFLDKVKRSPFADTSIKPLSLAHLCAIYQRIGNVPEQPKTIYRKVVGLLIEEWDEQRAIARSSAFESFQAYKKIEFLSHLAFYLTTTYQSSTFTNSQFIDAYQNICDDHELPLEKASEVVRELEAHTGLFIESGYEKFEFVHKSIQEYLTAEYIVKLPTLNTIRKDFESLGSELAIAVSISSNSSLYFVELVLNYFLRLPLSDSFFSSFTSRIISENPSFNKNKLISVTTLVLISNWINGNNKKYNAAKYDSFNEEFLSLFKALSDSIKLKDQKVKIFEFYMFIQGVHNNELVELARIKEPRDHKRLPSKIYLPKEFYEEFNF